VCCRRRRATKSALTERLLAFIREPGIKVLNVAGSRGSKELGVAAFVRRTLEDAFYPRVEAMVLKG
jgi:hypothetical protein